MRIKSSSLSLSLSRRVGVDKEEENTQGAALDCFLLFSKTFLLKEEGSCESSVTVTQSLYISGQQKHKDLRT